MPGALSWFYFKVFESLGLTLPDAQDRLKQFEDPGGFTCKRQTIFFGNFQIITATKDFPAA